MRGQVQRNVKMAQSPLPLDPTTVSGFAISTELYLCVNTMPPRHVGSMKLKLHII